jgi:hypothetical protein
MRHSLLIYNPWPTRPFPPAMLGKTPIRAIPLAFRPLCSHTPFPTSPLSSSRQMRWHTDKKENQIFLIRKKIQNGAVAKSYMRKSFLIYEEMRKYLTIYEEAVSHDFAIAPFEFLRVCFHSLSTPKCYLF